MFVKRRLEAVKVIGLSEMEPHIGDDRLFNERVCLIHRRDSRDCQILLARLDQCGDFLVESRRRNSQRQLCRL